MPYPVEPQMAHCIAGPLPLEGQCSATRSVATGTPTTGACVLSDLLNAPCRVACLPACLPVQEGSSSDAGHFGATAAAMPYLQGGTALSQAVSERLNDTG